MSEATDGILIWGAGAIGGALGAYFARGGQATTLVDIAIDHVEAVRLRGLRIEGPIETFAVDVDIQTPESLTGSWKTVLLCVKAHHTESAAQAMLPFLAEDGCVVSVQNGLNEEILADIVGPERVVGAFVNFGGDYLEPGVIHFGGRGAVVVGEVDGRDTRRVREIHAALRHFEPGAIASDNVMGFLWGKLAYGALLFATALTNDSIADSLAWVEARPVFVRIAQEAVAVADVEGVRLESFNGFDPDAFRPDVPAAAIDASFADMVRFNRRSAKTHSGIWRDLAVRRRRTEVDAQLGAVVRHAERLDMAVPLTRATIAMIHDIEQGRRQQSRDNLIELGHILRS